MSYAQVWYQDRYGQPYYMVSGMRMYGNILTHNSSLNNPLYSNRYSQAAGSALHRRSIASEAYEGYAARLPRVRFADEVEERSYSADKHSRRRSIREPPTIVDWPTYDEPKPRQHHKSTVPHTTIITADPQKRSKKYRNDTYYRDEYGPRSRSRSSSRESYGIDLLKVRPKSYMGGSLYYY